MFLDKKAVLPRRHDDHHGHDGKTEDDMIKGPRFSFVLCFGVFVVAVVVVVPLW